MSQSKAIDYWRQAAKEASVAAKDNFGLGHPDWGFFLWHLALEKLIKGLIIKNGDIVAPPIHDLVKLAKIAKLTLPPEREKAMTEISAYNIEARYDDYKRKFYKKASDKIYAQRWQVICGEIYLWLDKKY